MRRIFAAAGIEFYAHELIDTRSVVLPFGGRNFACLLWDHGLVLPDASSEDLCQLLLRTGCRYVVCGGPGCEAWHDLVDLVFVDEHLEASDVELDRAHVMTTWHSNELPDDVAFFFVYNTNFDDITFDRYLILHLGTGPLAQVIEDAVIAYAGHLTRTS